MHLRPGRVNVAACAYTVRDTFHGEREGKWLARLLLFSSFFSPLSSYRRHTGDLFMWQSWARICTATRPAPRLSPSIDDILRSNQTTPWRMELTLINLTQFFYKLWYINGVSKVFLIYMLYYNFDSVRKYTTR